MAHTMLAKGPSCDPISPNMLTKDLSCDPGAPAAGAGNGYEQGGNMMQNAYVADVAAGAAYPPQQHFAPNYMALNYMMPPQMEIPQQSSLKFKFPAHIISLVVRTTGCRLRDDKVVSIGAAFVKIPNHNTVPINVKHQLFQCKVDAQVQLDPEYMSADELKALQTQAKSPKQAIEAALAFVQDCIHQDASSFIAAQNPVGHHFLMHAAWGW